MKLPVILIILVNMIKTARFIVIILSVLYFTSKLIFMFRTIYTAFDLYLSIQIVRSTRFVSLVVEGKYGKYSASHFHLCSFLIPNGLDESLGASKIQNKKRPRFKMSHLSWFLPNYFKIENVFSNVLTNTIYGFKLTIFISFIDVRSFL